MIKVIKKLFFTFSIMILFGLNVNATDVGYTVSKQSFDGLDAYCIDAQYGPLKNLNSCSKSEVSGAAIAKAFSYNDYAKTQLALRLIGYRVPGMSKAPKGVGVNIYNETYTTTDFKTIASDINAIDVSDINISSGSSVIFSPGKVNYSTDKKSYTVTVNIIGPAGQELIIKNNGENIGRIIGSGSVNISGNIKSCKGSKNKLTAHAASNNGNGTGTGTSETSCTDDVPGTLSRDRYIFYNCGKSYQNYIIFVPANNKVPGTSEPGEPGDCDGDGNNDNDNNRGNGNSLGSYTLEVPDPNCNCDINYSEKFSCEGSEEETKFIKETDNIVSCITSGNYNGSCSGNSIEKTDDVSDEVILNDNPYCRVFCKEDIQFKMPGEVAVLNGRYFKLTSPYTKSSEISIEGTRTCYVGSNEGSDGDGINREQYIEDIIKAQNDIINAYNDYNKEKALVAAIGNATEQTSSCTGLCKVPSDPNSSNTGTSVTYYSDSESYITYSGAYNNKGVVTLNPGSATAYIEWGQKNGTAVCSNNKPTCTVTDLNYKTKTDAQNDHNNDTIAEKLDVVEEKVVALEEIVKKYNSCFDWTNKYCSFDPKLTFDYEEVYDVKGELKTKSITHGKTKDGDYYIEINEQYEGTSESLRKKPQAYVNLSGTSLNTKEYQVDMEHIYVKKQTTSKKEFEGFVDKKVCTYHPYGTIQTGNDCKENDGDYKLLDDGYVFPVSLEKAEKRQYNYDLKISNIGAPGNDKSCTTEGLNRIVGEACSQYEKVSHRTEGKYVCQYSSCPDCDVDCVCPEDNPECYVEDGICYYPTDVECPDCTVECIGCLWNDGDAAFGYKQVSLSDVFPNSDNNKDVGYNWNTEASVNPHAQKAEATLEEIEQEAEKVYTEPEYSYVLSTSTLGKIRAYNEAANAESQSSVKWGSGNNSNIEIPNGGYSNDTLTCTNGEKCTSSFLDGLDSIVGTNNYTRSDKWKVFDKITNSWKEE